MNNEKITPSKPSDDEEQEMYLGDIQKTCLTISGVVIIAIILGAIFGGDDDSGNNSNDRSPFQIGGGIVKMVQRVLEFTVIRSRLI